VSPAHADAAVLGYWPDRPSVEAVDTALTADELGYGELWVGEMATFDAFALATAVGLRATGLALTVGPLAVHVRTPAGMAMGVASVAELTGRPVHLAIGTSSPAVVAWHGRMRHEPLATIAVAAAEVRRLLAGERGSTGFRLRLPLPGSTLTVAAFGGKTVEVAARLADRMVLNMVTIESAATFRRLLDAAAARDGRAAPPRLAAWLPAAVDPAPEAYDQLARGLVQYLHAPGYGEQFISAGFADLVSMARTGVHPRELLAAVPPELAQSLGLVGTVAEVSARVAAYREAGVDEICVVPVTAGDDAGRRTLTALAP
jgi:probable F420-dependent oxidoreductase